MVDDVVGGHFNFGVGGELCEFANELLFPLPHGFGEKGFGEGKINVGITHGLKVLGIAFQVSTRAKMEAILLGSNPSIFSLWDIKSTRL
jgi:hypothetical protein